MQTLYIYIEDKKNTKSNIGNYAAFSIYKNLLLEITRYNTCQIQPDEGCAQI